MCDFDLECTTQGVWPLGQAKTVPAMKITFRDSTGEWMVNRATFLFECDGWREGGKGGGMHLHSLTISSFYLLHIP